MGKRRPISFSYRPPTPSFSSIAAAHGRRDGGLSLRIASLMSLMHPMSVDTYVERTARHAKLIVVRPLGGASYFRYLLEALHAAAVTHRFEIAVLPGDDKPDPGLEPFSTVAADDRQRLWAYFTEGGSDNAGLFLDYAAALVTGAEKPQPAKPLLKAGIWWPGAGVIGISEWQSRIQGRMVARRDSNPRRLGSAFTARSCRVARHGRWRR